MAEDLASTKNWREPMPKSATMLAGAVAMLALAASAQAQTLKASHQFPGGKGDARDEMVQIIAREAKAANVGLEVQVYPGASLFKPNEQWNRSEEDTSELQSHSFISY